MIRTYALITALAAALVVPVLANAGPKDCPPGLAKRDNGCLPPGLAKRYTIGEQLPGDIPYQVVLDLQKYGLTPPDGNWLYYLVDGEILRIADASFVVLQALGLVGQ